MNRSINTFVACLCMVALLASCGSQENNYPYPTHYLPVQLPGSARWSILDVETGQLVVKDAYDAVPSAVVDGMYYIVRTDGRYDFYSVSDPQHAVNAEPFVSVTSFGTNGLAIASKQGAPLCVIDKQCRVVRELPKEVQQCSMYVGGMAAFQNDRGLWGFLDEKGDTVIAARYASVNPFLDGEKAVVVDAAQPSDSVVTFGVIDKTGRSLFNMVNTQYRVIQPSYMNGVLPVVKGDTIVCLDGKGNEVPNPNGNHEAVDSAGYQDFSRTPAGYFIVAKNGKMGLVDHNNQVLIKPEHDRLIDLTADRYIALDDTIGHLVDRSGRPVGDVKFAHVHGTVESVYATRGFIDVDLAVASYLSLFGPGGCCGAAPGTTLMDMNSLVGGDPTPYVGREMLVLPQGPYTIQYFFDREVATAAADSAAASFNLDARVKSVAIVLNVSHCAPSTEQIVVNKIMGAMGTRGFILDHDGVFVSDAGTAVSTGYDKGVVTLMFYMNKADARPMPRNKR